MTSSPKVVFIDAEFTGEHARTTLISLGAVTYEGDEIYFALNDYDPAQVTEWIAENVLAHIDPGETIDSATAYRRLDEFLSAYADGQRLHVVSAGLLQDVLLMFELYHHACPERDYFHALHCLPDYLQHHAGIDLNTLFRICGVDPATDRRAYAGLEGDLRRHHALDDARVVRGCFMRMESHPAMSQLVESLRAR